MQERIFRVLPEGVKSNFHHPHSENALLWNTLYPRSTPGISGEWLDSLQRLWGGKLGSLGSHQPFFWGFSIEGDRLPYLDQALEDLDGAGPKTEVDLWLMSETLLVAVEVKHGSGFGRCSRYQSERCPEIHSPLDEVDCRYWEQGQLLFSTAVNFGERPSQGSPSPPCNRHYQLGRMFLLGQRIAELSARNLALMAVVPQRGWSRVERHWIDFMERVRDDGVWRRSVVLSWETLRGE